MQQKETTYEDFVRNLEGSLKRPKPLSAQIELTYHCNLDCVHCYCKGGEGEKELTTQEWKDIFDEIYKEECLWLTFTGGEPLVRDDFRELYTYVRKKGFLITIFTNGTVLPSETFELLKDKPPFLIEISLYGITREVYESVTQVAGSFRKINDNIHRLLQIKVPIVLKTVGLKLNKDEILKVKAFADRLLGKKKFKFDSFIIPRLNGDTKPCRYRLQPDEILEIEGSDEDMIKQRQKELHTLDDFSRPEEFLYKCDIWRSNFFINPSGRLQFCHLSRRFSCDLNQTSFKRAFYNEFPKLLNEKFTTGSKCKSCTLRKYCYFCPARAYLETGNREGPVEYYCILARARFKQEQLLKYDLGK